ncbi:hypothetical protein KGF57_001401 [Candida theae]|uniref:Uncharacterized protein n=1 Tax=Candida theae TaxID=1198502 RepID=A0AAD5BH07_9ASCO|nr:uncharacterized protein KGF57_001401 [Candida theae]KAI5962749.1 hypothetical protein KGF57_001401 [Candida theae]
MARSLSSSSEDDALIDDIEEIDYDLLPQDASVHKQPLQQQAPIPNRPKSAPPHLDNMRICLPPNKNNTNRYTNELFDATNHFIQVASARNSENFSAIPPDQKFLGCIEWNQMEEVDFEMDDVTRTRVFSNRFKRPIDEINPELSEYFRLHQNENKENLTKAYRVTKKAPSLNRRKSLPLVETNNIQKKVISPFKHKPIKAATRPTGVCQPRHQTLTPSKSCLSIENAKVYLMESSTGLVSQATDFATEINGSSDNLLPFPDNEDEVVQIPTNSNDAQQMAILRMYNVKLDRARKGMRTGFYSEKEFRDYQAKLKKEAMNAASGVEVVSQDTPREDKHTAVKERRVQWADNLEW